MRRGLLLVLVAAMFLMAAAVLFTARHAWAAPSTTTPTPRAVVDKMQGCIEGPFQIIGPADPLEAGPVVVSSPGGTFAIKEFEVTRMRNFAAVMLSRNPSFALLHVTFPERVGNGHLDTNGSDDFQRRVVDCFYGAYIGQDVV